jgi:repressor LexA
MATYLIDNEAAMEPLTPRQTETLAILRTFHDEYGFPPTLREIAAQLRISGTLAVSRHLAGLEKKGYLRRHAGGSRGITLLPQQEPRCTYPETPERIMHGDEQFSVFLPVVGVVRAGVPHPPVEDIKEYRSVDRTIARSGAAYFLQVKGDSMINAGVLEGDLALIKPQPTAENRDMVVALVDGEATLKWFYHEGNRVRLQPANPNMAAIYVTPDRDITIIGKVVGLFRNLA